MPFSVEIYILIKKLQLLLVILMDLNLQFKTGWFADHVLEAIRVRAMVRFLSVYPKSGAKMLLKQASNRFERLKRMKFLIDISKSNKKKQNNEGR